CEKSLKEILPETLVILDESHKIKSNLGVWSKSLIHSLKEANYMILLSGTPIPNGINDLYTQLQLLFQEDYDSYFGWDYNELENMINLESFNKKINPFFVRTNKDDLLVPKAEPDVIKNIKMSKEEENLFKQIYKEFGNSNPLELIIRCMQASSNPKLLMKKISNDDIEAFQSDEDDKKSMNKNNTSNKIITRDFKYIKYSSKFKECVNFIKKLVNNGKSIILWGIFIETMNDFFKYLNKEGVNCRIINGSVDIASREKIIDDFQKKEFSVLIANPNTIAESVSLHQNCHDAIYYEYSYNLTHLIQSKDRIHRLGLKEGTQTNYYFFNLINKNNNFNPIDALIYERLKQKEQTMLKVIERREIINVISNDDDYDWKKIIEKMLHK
ncbi:MAG: SNF2-related protein, partial [Metamycoplasmataceae bacterium]